MNQGNQPNNLERRTLQDRRVYDYLNNSGLDFADIIRYDRRKKKRRKALTFIQR